MAWINLSEMLENKKHEMAIVFVHGLNGDSSTWRNSSNRFADKLKSEKDVSENFSLHIFEYHTSIVELSSLRKAFSIIPGLKFLSGLKKFNAGIRRIAMQLVTSLHELLRDYKVIVLVGHSMGGLIIKRALVEMQEEDLKKVKLFMSLSVPHHGAALASIGAELMNNPQLIDLKTFSEFTNELTNSFSNLTINLKAIYQTGNQDKVVNEGSAIPAGVIAANRIDTDDNHYSVLTISDPPSHLPYRRLMRELKDILIWEQQQSISGRANDVVDFDIPENATFKYIAESLVETAGCTIAFKGFTGAELNTLLKSQELLKENTFQALESLFYIGQHPIPPYQVKIAGSHFEIVKS